MPRAALCLYWKWVLLCEEGCCTQACIHSYLCLDKELPQIWWKIGPLYIFLASMYTVFADKGGSNLQQLSREKERNCLPLQTGQLRTTDREMEANSISKWLGNNLQAHINIQKPGFFCTCQVKCIKFYPVITQCHTFNSWLLHASVEGQCVWCYSGVSRPGLRSPSMAEQCNVGAAGN